MTQEITKIKKRDGRVVDLDQEKITQAIFKALTITGQGDEKTAQKLSDKVVKILNRRFKKTEIPEVEQVQDIVEEVLMMEELTETAKAYILYREQRRSIREADEIYDEAVEIYDKYIDEIDWQVKENSNMAYSLQGLNNYGVSTLTKRYWLNKIYPKQIREAAQSGDFHIHNLDFLGAYCCGWDLYDLLKRGFGGVSGKVESSPPKHFRAALGQVVNFFYTLQGETAGAGAFSNFDTLLAPFIRYDNLDYPQVKQAMQEFLFNCAVPTRVGFQTPFTNITLDISPSPSFAKQPVILGGEPQKETYGDFQEEMNMLNKALYEGMAAGDKNGRIFTFPIPTISITKDFPWDAPSLEPMWQATAKYGVNYFANYIQSDMKPEDTRSMCPLGGSEKVLIRSSRGRGLEYSSIQYIFNGHSKQDEYWIYSDGRFVKGRFNKFENQEMIKVALVNNHQIKMSKEHLNFVLEDEKTKIKVLSGKELKPGMHLPYSLKVYEGKGGDQDLGYFVGAYAGDGSLDEDVGVIFSLNREEKEPLVKKLQLIAESYFGAHSTVTYHSKTKLLTLRINSKAVVGLCRDFVVGKGREKHYSPRLFDMSEEFRRGVIEGHYATDGGNSNRIYTSSPGMIETLNMLAATLGTTTSLYEDNRENRLGKASNFAVLFYQLNRKKLKGVWFKKYGKLWVKIKSIEKSPEGTAYCFEVKNDKPVFTVGTTGILTHNCRLRLDNRELYKRGGGLFGANPLTGAIGVVTINLPRLGYVSKTKKDFFQQLDRVMDLAKESLEIKRKALEDFMRKGLYPYSKHYLEGVEKMRGSYYGNHFSTIGLLGMNECLLNFMAEDMGSENGKKFALEVLDYMRERIVKYQEETDNLYNLEATPAEGASYKLCLKDKAKYPDIITAGTREVPYYTNSTQLPVNYTDDIFRALELQDECQCKYSGGTVLHFFLGEQIKDIGSIKALIKKVFSNFHLPYITLTPTFSVCPTHGYLSGEHWTCPKCTIEQKCEVYSRVVGYIRPVTQWHEGKVQEFKDRKVFQLTESV